MLGSGVFLHRSYVRQTFYIILVLSCVKSPASWSKIITNKNARVDAIYGVDDREFVTKKSDKKLQELARAIGYIVSNDYLKSGFFKTLIQSTTLLDSLNMCVDEKFVSSFSNPSCTGFLVAPNIMATAGHCFLTVEDCRNKKIIFDVDADKQTLDGFNVSSRNIFGCEKILAQSFEGNQDYAFIELDGTPRNRQPLKLNKSKKITGTDQVFMLGHPFGLPLVLSHKTGIVDNSNDHIFTTTLDSFEGNSGSPVINATTFLVEGILVNGQQDLVQDLEKGCYRNATHESGGEGVFRSSSLPTF
jgi:V8-like Glu-specific endopeptidase